MALFKVHRIELFNFKSYFGNVAIGPFDDFTCIVGPNGSGKSNIMDALSFILGASSASLRSASLDDFVHKKAKKRECSVTLVLKSDAGDEKRLCRILSSNKTQFSVDDIVCSEAEFSGALRRLRLGARLSTFLVFQHEVDSVARKKAKELTELIEGVSGSIELKPQYDAARRQLEEANKILMDAAADKRGAQAELHQLKLHQEEASRYTDLQARCAAERRDLALAELLFIETQLNGRKAKLAEQQALLQSLGGDDAEVKGLKSEYATKHKLYLEQLKESRVLGNKLRDNRTTLDRIKASRAHFTAKLARLKAQHESSARGANIRAQEASRLREQLASHERAFEKIVAKWEEEDKGTEKLSKLSKADMETYRALRQDAECATITDRQSLATLRRQREAISEASKDVQLQMDRHHAAEGEFEAGLAAASDKRAAIREKIGELSSERKEVSTQLEAVQGELVQTTLRRQDRDKNLAQVENLLRELRFTKEENRHSSRVNEALVSLKALFPGVRGRFTDLCDVKESKYKYAATVAFGNNMDAIVVDNVETAMSCVRYLKEQRVASLTFIPLASVQGQAVTDELRALGSKARPLVDVLKFDVTIEPAIRYAVGQTIVCDTLHDARKVAFGGEVRRKVVTLDGNILLKSGAIQGGLASIQARAAKWDEKQYNELKRRQEEYLRMGDDDVETMRLQQRGRELQSRLEFIDAVLQKINAEAAAIDARIASAPSERKKITAQKSAAEKTLNDLKSQIRGIDAEIEKRTARVVEIEQRTFAEFQTRVGIANIAEVDRELQRREKIRADARSQFELVRNKLKMAIQNEEAKVSSESSASDLAQAVTATERELGVCARDEAKCEDLTKRAEEAFKKSQSKVSELKAALDQLEARIRDHGRASDAQASALSAARKQRALLLGACEALRAQRQRVYLRCRMEDIELPLVEQGASSSKRQRDTDLSREEPDPVLRSSETFSPGGTTTLAAAGSARAGRKAPPETVSIDFSGVQSSIRQVTKSADKFKQFRDETERAIQEMLKEMDSLAPNLKAKEHVSSTEAKVGSSSMHLDEMKRRSAAALKEFTKVKEQRTSRFMHTFQRIVEHVDTIYKELTVGTRATDVHGSAYLALEDPDEPYRGGTRYHATPPMKRYMSMEQLSGGERTMAAMALLFAIHATAPTPFFVLDEVDAALDIGNVVKLGNYLRSHAGPSSQYIVVSLKEQLYHLANTLIGVYKDTTRESSNVMSLSLANIPHAQH